jgi:hypothetical protein
VVKYICYYIHRNNPTIQVRNFLQNFLLNEDLLSKSVIVNDDKLYNFSFTVRKDTITASNEEDLIKLLELYEKEAECIFLNLVSFDSDSNNSVGNLLAISEHEDKPQCSLIPKTRYRSASRKKRKEKETWQQYFSQTRDEILNFLFDEYNGQILIYQITGEKVHKDKAEQFMKIIKYSV